MNHYPFELKPLPYAFDALEPFIDEKTMFLHHNKHLATYIKNLNAALKDYPDYHDWTLEQLLFYSNLLPAPIRSSVINNGGGVYNHNFFFSCLKPAQNIASSATDKPKDTNLMDAQNERNTQDAMFKSVDGAKNHPSSQEETNGNVRESKPSTSDLRYAIKQTFGSFEEFKVAFKESALSVFGSGYTFLVVTAHGSLQIQNTRNQDTTIPLNVLPIICIDVWEHAYYLKNYNNRSEYIDNFFKVLNETAAEENYLTYGELLSTPTAQ